MIGYDSNTIMANDGRPVQSFKAAYLRTRSTPWSYLLSLKMVAICGDMKLPYSDRLEISQPKVVQYLLSSTHRAGRGKARFFSAFGFQVSSWEALAKALHHHATENVVLHTEETLFGTRYVIAGPLIAPNGRELQFGLSGL